MPYNSTARPEFRSPWRGRHVESRRRRVSNGESGVASLESSRWRRSGRTVWHFRAFDAWK